MFIVLFIALFFPNALSFYLNLSTSNYPPLVYCETGKKMSFNTDTVFNGLEIDLISYFY